jgi:hypothetical protein
MDSLATHDHILRVIQKLEILRRDLPCHDDVLRMKKMIAEMKQKLALAKIYQY